MNTEQNHRDKARTDGVYQDLREILRAFATLVNSRQMLTLQGVRGFGCAVETALLAERLLNDLGLTLDPEFIGADLYEHDGIPPTDPVYIGDMKSPQTKSDYERLNVHLVYLLERIARDSRKVESLGKLLRDDADRGTQAAGILRMIVKHSVPDGVK